MSTRNIKDSFFTIFNLSVGIVMILILVFYDQRLLHLAIIGLLSILVSYGINKKQRWVIFISAILFFSGMTFGFTTLISSLFFLQEIDIFLLIFNIMIISYMIVLTVFFLYLVSRRRSSR